MTLRVFFIIFKVNFLIYIFLCVFSRQENTSLTVFGSAEKTFCVFWLPLIGLT